MTPEPLVVYWDMLQYNEWTFHLAATDKGLCCITLPNETFDTLQQWVKKHAAGANLMHDTDKLHPYIVQVEEYIQARRSAFLLPLDLRGTPFQVQVWKTLLQIPYGTTRTYSEIAAQLGRRKAVRAVGAANGANPIPIVVPCHRVVGKNGALTGYRGGVDMKAALLTLEGATLTNP